MEPGIILYENSFLNRSESTLYVPYGSENAYKAAEYWRNFNIVGYDPAGVTGAHVDNDVNVAILDGQISITGTADRVNVEVYGMNGSLLYKGSETSIPILSNGMYIVKVNGKPFKVIN